MTQLVRGSLSDIARNNNTSIAQAFMNATAIILVDVSGSMDLPDCPGNRKRYDLACEQLIRLQRDLSGQVAVIAWDNTARFCPGGIPSQPGGSTDLANALKFVYPADGTGVRLIVISDGVPDDQQAALAEAQKFTTKLDCVFVGPENGPGRDFLKRLAAASGGTFADQTVAHLPELAATIQKLIAA